MTPDPEELLLAETQVPSLPASGVPEAPGVPGASPVAAEAPLPPSRALEWLRGAWRKLTTPTSHLPSEYRNRLIAMSINRSLDKARGGLAHEYEVGESVSLAMDHLRQGRGGAQTPLGHLTSNWGRYGWHKLDHATEQAERAAAGQPLATSEVIHHPLPPEPTPEPVQPIEAPAVKVVQPRKRRRRRA